MSDALPSCDGGNDYDGRLGLRISAVFVIMVGSCLGALFPVACVRLPFMRKMMPSYVYLFARYFGSGVIVATAFIHLLAPASDELTDPCLGGTFAKYDWAEAIAMMSVWAIFLLDLLVGRYVEQKYGVSDSGHMPHMESVGHEHFHDGEDGHMHHTTPAQGSKEIKDVELAAPLSVNSSPEPSLDQGSELKRQFAAFLVLEFGVLFHSVIIGLALAVAGSEFVTLYVVIVFHQTFEGLGLGARLSTIPFPKGSKMIWLLAGLYGCITPIAIAIGIGLRETYKPESREGLIVSGVLDALSAGILLYTGLVELLAHDFIFNKEKRSTKVLTFQLVCALLGSGLMALLGKWA